MTRVFENSAPPAAGSAQTRALIVGVGRYPHAQIATDQKPKLKNLDSVGPSIWEFVGKLLREWRNDLLAPLATVDLLLSESTVAVRSQWSTLGVPGEIAAGTPIDEPTVPNLNNALAASLKNPTEQDHFLFLCCGHGFWKTRSYFALGDFGANDLNCWEAIVDLDGFRMGLAQTKLRRQWLFSDCCKDIPDAVLKTLSQIGTPLIATNAEEIVKANRLGKLYQYGLSSAAPGLQAFGIPGKPSRFCEMLLDALGGAGAISKHCGQWCVDDRGISDAVRTYAKRNPELSDPEFYNAALPLASDMPDRLRFRNVASDPKSRIVVFSKPRTAMKDVNLSVLRDGNPTPIWNLSPVGRAKIMVELPARLSGKVKAIFNGKEQEIEVYGALPTAEPDEAEFKYE